MECGGAETPPSSLVGIATGGICEPFGSYPFLASAIQYII